MHNKPCGATKQQPLLDTELSLCHLGAQGGELTTPTAIQLKILHKWKYSHIKNEKLHSNCTSFPLPKRYMNCVGKQATAETDWAL